MNAKVLTVITASLPSAANQLLPGPSGSEGHKMFEMSLKPDVEDEGEP
jgi:hypothetical protein